MPCGKPSAFIAQGACLCASLRRCRSGNTLALWLPVQQLEAQRRAKLDDRGRQAAGMSFYEFQVSSSFTSIAGA